MGGIFHYDSDTGTGYYMDDQEVAEAGAFIFLGMGALAIFCLVVIIVGLAIISPFITLFVLDDFVKTFVANNALFFAGVGIVIVLLKLVPKTTDLRTVRILFDVYIIITVLYITLYVLHFDIPVYSCFKIIDNYLPAGSDRALLDAIGMEKLYSVLEGNWFYEFACNCVATFINYIKWLAARISSIDNSCFQAAAAQIDILAVIKTVLLYVMVGGLGFLSVLLIGIVMVLAGLIAVAIPYALALAAVVICNKIIFKMHTGSVKIAKKDAAYQKAVSEDREEFDFLLSNSSGSSMKRVFEVCQELANDGNLFAQIRLAQCYLHEEGTQMNEEKAFHWYHEAASNGMTKGQLMVAFFYFDGIGVKKNRRLSKVWLCAALKDKEFIDRHKEKADVMRKIALVRKKTKYLDCL